jgi:hypothetical protein
MAAAAFRFQSNLAHLVLAERVGFPSLRQKGLAWGFGHTPLIESLAAGMMDAAKVADLVPLMIYRRLAFTPFMLMPEPLL